MGMEARVRVRSIDEVVKIVEELSRRGHEFEIVLRFGGKPAFKDHGSGIEAQQDNSIEHNGGGVDIGDVEPSRKIESKIAEMLDRSMAGGDIGSEDIKDINIDAAENRDGTAIAGSSRRGSRSYRSRNGSRRSRFNLAEALELITSRVEV